MHNAFVHGARKKTICTVNFSKPSRTTWAQILNIEHKDETVNKSYGQFLFIIKRDKIPHFWLLQKFCPWEVPLSLSLSVKAIISTY